MAAPTLPLFSTAGFGDPVSAGIYYLKPDPLYDEEKPYSLEGATTLPPGMKRTNIVNSPTRTTIWNAREKKSVFSLYAHGFEWAHHELTYDLGFGEDEARLDRYMNEMGEFLRCHLKASKVIVYDYVVSTTFSGI